MNGKNVVVGTQIHGPQGRSVGWTMDSLQIIPPLPKPAGLVPKNAPDAIELDWHAAAPQFRVFRQGPGEADFRQIATADKPTYVDHAIDFGKTYRYEVQSIQKTGDKYVQSEMSDPVSFTPADRFAPAVPSGLTAVQAPKSIELVWDRNAERDLASYRVYRNGMKIADGLTSPSYSDKDVMSGTTYRYQVSAVDNAGNESAQSPVVEAGIP
jgi:fibronectin type 3 domain-containing protein